MTDKKNVREGDLFEAAVIPTMQRAQEAVPIPGMQAVKAANVLEVKGAPIPNMQPVQQTGNTPSGGNNQGSSGNQGTGNSSGQAGAKS